MKTSFAELTKQVNFINDMIISDLKCAENMVSEQESNFTKRLMTTKYWFSKISWVNKKKYLLTLLKDVQSAWTLSLLLKSCWNCRPKDSVMSVCQVESLSSFDEVPLDHNRTALPVTVLAQVMKTERLWFLSLEPEPQALVLCELLPVGGGPLMWEVLRRARILYDRYTENLVASLQNHGVFTDGGAPIRTSKREVKQDDVNKSEPPYRKESKKDLKQEEVRKPDSPRKAQKDLDAHLATWNATLKSIRDSQKLEELEMTFNDGTTRKIWKVNRPRPEVVETVDFLQQLPSAIGKRILSFLPRASLGDYARVNKYWAYLVDELRLELSARAKINADYEKLNELLHRLEPSLEPSLEKLMVDVTFQTPADSGESAGRSPKTVKPLPSVRPSEKSAAYSMRFFMNGRLNKPFIASKPIRNMKDLTERLERRGAADESLWRWCQAIRRQAKQNNCCSTKEIEGVLPANNGHFPCPYMKLSIHLPLNPPLYQDPAMTPEVKLKRNPSNATLVQIPNENPQKRYNLWTRNLTTLYPVFKIPSHQSPV